MRLFSRIFLSHLLSILVACLAFAGAVGLVSPEFYRRQLDTVFLLVTPEWAWLRVSLEEGQQRVMLLSLLASFPVSVLLAAGTAYFEARRITAAVRRLAEGSREIAEGRYGRRLEVGSQDELGAIALHFNRMAEALEGAARSRAEMIGAVVHEVRTPLAHLRSYAEALADGVLPAEEATRAIVREVSLLHRITDDLLLVARIEAGEVALQLAPHRPEELLADAQERFVHAYEDEGVGLEVALAKGLPQVRADRERAHQVLGNLLSNALYHTPTGGCVRVGAEPQGDGVRFFVADNGPGIPPEHLPHLFERFYRVDGRADAQGDEQGDAGRSRSHRRLGTGLTIAKGLVEAMGGSMWVESEPGRGSTFFFTLPSAAGSRSGV